MAKLQPFKALMYTKKAGDIAFLCAPPYDIISPEEQDALYDKSEHNIVRLELPKGDNKYEDAKNTLLKWRDDGILQTYDEDALYVYEMTFTVSGQTRSLTLFTSYIELSEFEKGIVMPHEETLSKAKQDRFELLKQTGCSFSQIYSIYSDEKREIKKVLDRVKTGQPDISFRFSDDILHKLWILTDPEDIEKITATLIGEKIYIADGHHRYETAINYRNYLREQGINAASAHPSNYCMMAFADIDDPGLVVLPTHRIINSLSDRTIEQIVDAVSGHFDVSTVPSARELEDVLDKAYQNNDIAFGLISSTMGYAVLKLRYRGAVSELMPEKSEAYRSLDVAVLHSMILEPILGIDAEKLRQGESVRYTRSSSEAARAVFGGNAPCAFVVNPTRVSQIKDVAAANEKMPQKSTYFYPKLITGIVMNEILPSV